MVHVLVRIKVENFDKWRLVFDTRSTIRKEAGSKEAHVFRNSEDHNQVVILFEWDNKEKARKFFETDIVQKTMLNEGTRVISQTYLEEVEKTT